MSLSKISAPLLDSREYSLPLFVQKAPAAVEISKSSGESFVNGGRYGFGRLCGVSLSVCSLLLLMKNVCRINLSAKLFALSPTSIMTSTTVTNYRSWVSATGAG